MNLIKKQIFNRIVADQEKYNFDIIRDSVYLISISVKCKNWRQNFKRLFNDDDLAIDIDNFPLHEYRGKRKEFNTPASWNGNELKNNKKINYFIIPFSRGSHSVRFSSDGGPLVEEIDIFDLTLDNSGDFILSGDIFLNTENNKIFFDIAIKNTIISHIKISARANHNDKLQLKINNQIEENRGSKKYKVWYWIGSQLKGKNKELNKDISINESLHFLEFRGRGNPIIECIVFSLKEFTLNKLGRIVLYKDIIDSDFVYLRSETDHDNPQNIIIQLKNDDTVEILEELVIGKWVYSKSDVWHKIKYRDKTGYVLSSFVEIQGQERERVFEIIRCLAQKLDVNKDWMLALAGCESRYKTYATSNEDRAISAKGIFQLTPPAIEQLKKLDVAIDEEKLGNIFELENNIESGIRYFKWLYETYYKNKKQAIEKTAVAYNVGQGYVPASLSLDLNRIDDREKRKRAEIFLKAFLENNKRKNWKNIFWPIVLLLFFVSVFGFSVKQNNTFRQNNYYASFVAEFLAPQKFDLSSNKNNLQKFYFRNINFHWSIGRYILTDVLIESIDDYQRDENINNLKIKITYNNQYKKGIIAIDGYLDNAYLYDIDGHGSPSLIVNYSKGNYGKTQILSYNYQTEALEPIRFIKNEGKIFEEITGRLAFIPQVSLEDDIAILNYYSKYEFTPEACSGFIQTIYTHNFPGNDFKERTTTNSSCIKQPRF